MSNLEKILRCPSERALSDAFSAGADIELLDHVDKCSACGAQWARWEALVTQATELPTFELSAHEMDRSRASLLVRARAEAAAIPVEESRAVYWPWIARAAAAAAIAFLLWPQAEAPMLVESEVQQKQRPHTVHVEQPKAAAPQLAVVAATDRVAVVDAADAPVPKAPVVQRRRHASRSVPVSDEVPKRPAPTQSLASVAEVSFREGWTAFREGHYELAAAWFARVPKEAALGQDAIYWQGIALKRAGKPGPAIAALTQFVDGYPKARRRAEAAVVLGKLLQRQNQGQRAAGYLALGLLAEDESIKNDALLNLKRR